MPTGFGRMSTNVPAKLNCFRTGFRHLFLFICFAFPLLLPSSRRQVALFLVLRQGSSHTADEYRRVNTISCRTLDISCCSAHK